MDGRQTNAVRAWFQASARAALAYRMEATPARRPRWDLEHNPIPRRYHFSLSALILVEVMRWQEVYIYPYISCFEMSTSQVQVIKAGGERCAVDGLGDAASYIWTLSPIAFLASGSSEYDSQKQRAVRAA